MATQVNIMQENMHKHKYHDRRSSRDNHAWNQPITNSFSPSRHKRQQQNQMRRGNIINVSPKRLRCISEVKLSRPQPHIIHMFVYDQSRERFAVTTRRVCVHYCMHAVDPIIYHLCTVSQSTLYWSQSACFVKTRAIESSGAPLEE